MAFTRPQVPFKLTAQDMGVANLPQAVGQGASVVDQMIGSRLKEMQAQTAQAELDAGVPAAKAKYMQAQAALENLQAQNLTTKLGYLMGGNQNNTQGAPQETGSGMPQSDTPQIVRGQSGENTLKQIFSGSQTGYGQPGQSYYGVMMPAPTRQQIGRGMYGMYNTYPEQKKIAADQQQKQINSYNEMSENANKMLTSSQNQLNLVNQYQSLMDGATLRGQWFGNTPTWASSQLDDQIDKISAQMGQAGIQNLKDAMGNSRFTQLEFNYGTQNLTPTRAWSDKARNNYANLQEAATNRNAEKVQFVNYFRNNPQLGLQAQDVDTLWANYTNQFPIINKDGQINYKNSNKWREYTTPEAIVGLKRYGSYKPSDKKKIDAMISKAMKGQMPANQRDTSMMTLDELRAERDSITGQQ